MPWLPSAAVVAAAMVLLAGCGGATPRLRRPRRRPPPGVGKVTVAPDGVQEVTLQTQDDYVFTPDHFTVAPGQGAADRGRTWRSRRPTTSTSRPTQGPRAIDASIPLLAPGEQKTIDFDVADARATTPSSAASTSSWGRSAR